MKQIQSIFCILKLFFLIFQVKAAPPLKDINMKKLKLPEDSTSTRPISVIPPDENIQPITDEEIEELKKISPDAAYFRSFTDDSSTDTASDDEDACSFPPTISKLCEQYCITNVESMKPYFTQQLILNLERKTRSQRNKLWKEHRLGRLTSSKFGEIIKKKKISQQFVENFIKIPNEINAPQIKWGVRNERVAFSVYQTTEEKKHTCFSLRRAGLYISLDDPYLGSSPDGIIECQCCYIGDIGVLEIKCPCKFRNLPPADIAKFDNKFCLDTHGNIKEDHEYSVQIQGQMSITGAKYCDFVV